MNVEQQLSEIRMQLNNMQHSIGELRGEVKGYAATHVRHESELARHDGRLRKVESKFARFIGYALGAGAVAAVVLDSLLRLL